MSLIHRARKHAGLRKAVEVLDHGGVVWRSETSDRVPARGSVEALTFALAPANSHAALCDVVEHAGVLVKGRVGKTDGLLADSDALLVDAGEDGGEDGGRHGRATVGTGVAIENNSAVVSDGSYVRIAAASAVVDAASTAAGDGAVGSAVGGEARVVLGEEAMPLVRTYV